MKQVVGRTSSIIGLWAERNSQDGKSNRTIGPSVGTQSQRASLWRNHNCMFGACVA